MKKCLIVSGGELCPAENKEYDLIIACDRGYENCKQLGIRPDLIIGDFDSYEGSVQEDIPVLRLNPIKDDTDTISAVRYALDKGCGIIEISCVFGGRFDHSIANLQTAAFILENGASPILYGRGTVVYAIENSELRLKKRENSYLSVFAASDICRGVTISGTKYKAADAALTPSYPIGVSNEWEDDEAYICVKEGKLLVIISENIRLV